MKKTKTLIAASMLVLSLTLSGCTKGIKIEKKLNLPDDYYVEIEVTQSSKAGNLKSTYAISETSGGWVYMRFGADSEQYVYKPVSEGKYIEYKYDTSLNAYKPTMISDTLQEQIDKGNVSLESVATSKESVDSSRATMEQYTIPYATMGSIFVKGLNDTYLGRQCETYSGEINAIIASSSTFYAIDQETGLTMEMQNKTRSWFTIATQTNVCVAFESLAKIPEI